MMRVFEKIALPGTLAAALFVGVAMVPSYAVASTDRPEVNAGLMTMGEKVYGRECAACHGVKGEGDGPGAYLLFTKPRNFDLGVYMLRTTPNGEFPTDDDLFRAVTNGIPNSMMPSFRELPAKERWALVEVVKRLSAIDETPATIDIPAAPQVTTALLKQGEQVYTRLKCAACHGAAGQADGPSSLTLKNDAKERVWAADLTMGVFKGGSTAEDLYTRVITGMDGSPMPSYATQASPDEIWALVHYVKTLAKNE